MAVALAQHRHSDKIREYLVSRPGGRGARGLAAAAMALGWLWLAALLGLVCAPRRAL
jgi:hypothetical protein